MTNHIGITLQKGQRVWHVVLPTGALLCGRPRVPPRHPEQRPIHITVSDRSDLVCFDCRVRLMERARRRKVRASRTSETF